MLPLEIERVLSTAAELFAKNGYNGVGMRDISQNCEISIASMYHYFGSKEMLYEAICSKKYTVALAAAQRCTKTNLPVEDQLVEFAITIYDLLIDDRVLMLLFRRDLIDGSIGGNQLRSQHQTQGIISLLSSLIKNKFSDVDAANLAFTIASLVFGYSELTHVSINDGNSIPSDSIPFRRENLRATIRKLVKS